LRNTVKIYCITLAMLILLPAFLGVEQVFATGTTIKTIAVLPVHVNSTQDLDYIKKGMVQMFDSRLSWNKKVAVISGDQIKDQIKENKPISQAKLIHKIAEQTHSDFALACIVTELSGSFSIDAKVYDIANMKYMTFFENSKKIDDLIKKTDRIAATINKKIFGRVTVSWKRMEMEKQEYINNLKRQNPEYLIKNRQLKNSEESYGWKIWKHLF
jgi:Tol biopolymer transport system component